MDPRNPQADLVSALRGAIDLHNRGQLDQADAIYQRVLQHNPRHPDALHLRALVFHVRGDQAMAAELAERAIAAAPHVANFYNTAGNALRLMGRLAEAQRRLEQATAMAPGFAIAHNNLSLVLSEAGDVEHAKSSNRRALAADPNCLDAWIQALQLAIRDDDSAAAEEVVARLESAPTQPVVRAAICRFHLHKCRQHVALGEFAVAQERARVARAYHPHSPEAWLALATASDLGSSAPEAELHFSIAANLAPHEEKARLALTHHLQERKRFAEAESHYAAWLESRPESASARFGRAGILLARGDYLRGWVEYESRWDLPQHTSARFVAAPAWDGAPLRKLLLYAEQGLGDSLQMLRFVERVLARVEHVVLLVPPALERLVARAFTPRVAVVTALAAGESFDAACPLMSLPRVLQATRAEDLAIGAPYLAADPRRVEHYEGRLRHVHGKTLGLVWRGGAAGGVNFRRAVPEEAWRPLLDMAGWTPVSLQVGAAARIGGVDLFDLAAEIADFDDLAAAMHCMDAIVCVDTGPAHLAGALGLRCFTLVPWLHDWRWGVAGEDTCWYPTMTLIRQFSGETWERPIRALTAALSGQPATTPEAQPPAKEARIVEENLFPYVVVACRDGKFKLPLFDRLVTLSMLAYGQFSAREVEVLLDYVRDGDTVIDVGAHFGTSCVPLARGVGKAGRVIAFEPQSTVHDCLVDTVNLNALHWVDVRRQAVGHQAGECTMSHCDPCVPGKYRGTALIDATGGDRVTMVAIDELSLDTCRLLRVDVGGAELDVLAGAEATIERCRPVLHVESNRENLRKPLADFLRARGYSVYLHASPLYADGNFRRCPVDLFPSAYAANLLALPSGETAPADAVPYA